MINGYLLFFRDKTPIVLDEDLKVYVRINKYMKSGQHFRKIGDKYFDIHPNTYVINGGFDDLPQKYVGCDAYCINLNYSTACQLHRLGDISTFNTNLFHAVIPKGTPFYYSVGKYIVPERFYISNIVTEKDNGEWPSRDKVYQLYLEKHYTGKTDSVNVGDMLLNDKKTYLNYTQVNKYNIDNVIGIVVGFKKDGVTPLICALMSKRKPLAPMKLDTKGIDIDSWEDSEDGYENTRRLVESGLINAFPGAKYCTNYSTKGTKAGDWYLPSIEELREFAKNYDLLHSIALKLRFWAFHNLFYNLEYDYYNYSCTYSVKKGTAYIKNLTHGQEVKTSGRHVQELVHPFLKL